MHMTYPNAYLGVKRLFSSRILALIGGFAMLISLSFAIILDAVPEEATGGDLATGGLIAVLALSFMLVSAVVLIISFILGITGLSKASLDEPAFRVALFATLANIIIVGFGSMFTSMNNSFMASLMNSFSTIADLIIFIYIILGIRSLAAQIGDDVMDRKGNNLFKILLVVLILEFIANLIVAIFRGAQTASIVASVVAVIGAILTIIQYVMFLVYLAKARKMLANA